MKLVCKISWDLCCANKNMMGLDLAMQDYTKTQSYNQIQECSNVIMYTNPVPSNFSQASDDPSFLHKDPT